MDVLSNILSSVDPVQLVLVWFAVLGAAVLRSFTGFGFGLAAVPVFALFMPPTQAVVLSACLAFTISVLSLRTYWGVYPLRPLLPMLTMALLGTALGVFLLGHLQVRQFQLWVGIAVIATCVVLTRYHPRQRSVSKPVDGAAGLLSGVLNGAFSIPGPPVVIYAMVTETDAARSRSLLMTFFLFSALLALVFYAAAGFFVPATPWLFAMALPAILLGDRLGYWLFTRYGTRFYRRVALLLLFAVGLAVIARSLL